MKTRKGIRLSAIVAFLMISANAVYWNASSAPQVTRTWDGGGVTNNWSEAANWSGDVTPTSDDIVVFDGTSTKNAVVDVSVAVPVFSVNSGYTGTITLANGIVFTTFNNFGFNQADGTISAGAARINAQMIVQNAGTFNGGSGDVSVANGITIAGGTFNAPSGTLFVSGGFDHRGGVFNHNGGTVRLGNGGLRFVDQDTFNNLTIDAPLNINTTSDFGSTGFNIIGTLRMVAGTVFNFGVTMNLTGDLVFAPGYTSNGPGDAFLRLAGTTPRTVTFPTGIQFFRLKLSSADTIVNFSGPDPITFQSLTIEQGRFDQGSTTLNVLQNFDQTGGTFNAGSAPLNQFGNNFTIDGGTFNGGSGDVTVGLNFGLSNGTFNAPSGSLILNAGYNHSAGVFNANGGTVAFTRGGCNPFTFPNNETFNNLIVNRECTLGLSAARLIVLGTLTLTRGFLGGRAILEARGDVIVQPTWGQEFGLGPGDISFEFGGSSNQTFTNNGAANFVGEWSVNKPSGTVNLASDLDLRNGSTNAFRLTNGTITTGNFVVKIGIRNRIRTNGYVNGNLEQSYPFPGGPFLPVIFDVGTDNGYSPVEITAQTVSVASSIRVRAVQGTHPAVNPAIALGRYWAITESGDITARLKFSYLDGDVNGNESNYKVDRITNGQVEIFGPSVGSVNPATNTATTAELTDFADFTLSTLALPLTISPTDVFADCLNPQDFSFAGGNPPFVYSLQVNNSGATINSVSGLYQAGPTNNVNDTVRVTDGEGNFAEATVRVVDPFVVANTNEAGGGSLNRAITNANNTPGVQTISFNIAGTAPFTIATSTVSIPSINDPVIIDATTQPGYSGTPLVEVKRAGFGGGLTIGRGPTTVRGLAISGYVNNINIRDALLGPCGGNVIEANLLGIGLTTPSSSQSSVGIKISDCDGNFIGGPLPSQRNVISGNRTTGIDISIGVNNKIRGNFIGTAPDGIAPMPNRANIRITGADNTVGGTDPGEGNVIAFANNPTAERGTGVLIIGGAGNRVRGNSIHSNSGLGIELPDLTGPPPDGTFGVTPNDPCDADGASNDLQNFPVLTSAVQNLSNLRIQGTLNSTPGRTFDLDFYASDAGDPSGNGEGKFYLGSTQVSTDGGCNGSFDLLLPVTVVDGQVISATATASNGSTSEFSAFIAADVFDPQFTVVNTSPFGFGSLSQAILNANATPGRQTIRFAIPGSGPFSIRTQLPCIDDPAVIDATTQQGFSGSPVVELNGTGSAWGICLLAGNSEVRGLAINRFGVAGILIQGALGGGAGNNKVQGNFIGTDVSGNVPLGNDTGILILDSPDNLIGGGSAATRNVISGNTSVGVSVGSSGGSSAGTVIAGNFVGTNVASAVALGNQRFGIQLQNVSGIRIGGSQNGERNVISGNSISGIDIFDVSESPATGNFSILGNFIGTNAAGTSAVPNNTGILFRNSNAAATNVAIGGTSGGEGNTISGNTFAGVLVNGKAAGLNIAGNRIGLGPSLNSIANGIGVAVFDQSAASTRITENRIFGNTSAGIILAGLPNDPADPDTGPNGLQNNPVLTSAVPRGSATTVAGSLNSTPSTAFVLEFFSSPTCDASGAGEGETFLGSTTVTTDSGGLAGFTNDLGQVASGRVITATATAPDGSTSEFSRCQVVTPVNSISGRLTANGQPVGFATVNLSGGAVRSVVTDSNGNYSFNDLPSNLSYTVTPVSSDLAFTPAFRAFGNLSNNQTNQDFAGTRTRFTVSGNIARIANSFRVPLSGATVTLNGSTNASAVTDINGNYRFSGVLGGSYTLSATKPDFFISPGTVILDVSSDQFVNFTAQTALASPLEGRIYFTRNGDNLFGMNADGSGLVVLVEPENVRSTISPDGRKLAFQRNNLNIAVAAEDGSGLVEITSGTDPAFSPDGSKIAISKNVGVGGGREIFTMNPDGTALTRITFLNDQQGTVASFPNWSPDGSKIVFTNNSDISVVDLANGAITTIATNGILPDWSPDGTKIIFARGNTLNTMNPDGTNQRLIVNNGTGLVSKGVWSPDGARILFSRQNRALGKYEYVAADADGGNQIVLLSDNQVNQISFTPDWGITPVSATPVGTNVSIGSGAVSITFPGVMLPGQTSVVPIPPASAGTAPGGFVLGTDALEITTTANFTPPVTVCFNVPETSAPTAASFNALAILHSEGGVLIDRTVSRDFSTRRICASVNSFSPFVLGAQVDPSLASIAGVVVDSNGAPLVGVNVRLGGAENRIVQTDSRGLFGFVNLANGGNYSVQASEDGFVFNEYSRDFIGLAGENTVMFTGSRAAFQIAGTVRDRTGNPVAGVRIGAAADGILTATTDGSGNYLFSNLPGDGSYSIAPIDSSAAPAQRIVGPLLSSVSGVDFVVLSQPVATVSISGQVRTALGLVIPNVIVSLTAPDGSTRSVRTNSFGFYRFDDVAPGARYSISVRAKEERFPLNPRQLDVNGNLVNIDFVGSQ